MRARIINPARAAAVDLRTASISMATMMIPTTTCNRVTSVAPSQRAFKLSLSRIMYSEGSAATKANNQSYQGIQSRGDRRVIGKRRNAKGIRNNR